MRNPYLGSPFNYPGNKHKLMPQIAPLFPKGVDIFYDIFTGGCTVPVNMYARKFVVNDVNWRMIEILKTLKKTPVNAVLAEMDHYIKSFNLTKEHKEGFFEFRENYNHRPNPIKLYTLMCFSYNYQMRFNGQGVFNSDFGRGKHFSAPQRKKLINFMNRLHEMDIEFCQCDFEDFVLMNSYTKHDFLYFDPPYLICTAVYHDGNKGFVGWSEAKEKAMYAMLDKLDKRGIKWALSNVIEHKGKQNEFLYEFSERYFVHYVDVNYKAASYNAKPGDSTEVFVTNYVT